MTIQYVNTGSSPNKGDGDSIRAAFNKINENFRYLSTITGSGGVVDIGTGTGAIIANLGDIRIDKATITTTATNEDIIFDPNGFGRVRLRNTPLQFDNGTGGNIGPGAQILYTRGGSTPVGLAIDDVNSSLRIVGDKQQLGTLVDMGLYTGPLNSWVSKVYIDYRGSIFAQGNIKTLDDFEADGNIFSMGNITAGVDLIADRYVQAAEGIKFADGTIQTSAVSTTTATHTVLGLIRLGGSLKATGDGVVDVNIDTNGIITTATIATTTTVGVIKVGGGLAITTDGLLSVRGAETTGTGGSFITSSTVATTSSLGIVQIGSGLSINPQGILSLSGSIGLGNLLVDDTTLYPNTTKPVIVANQDTNIAIAGASYINIPAVGDTINDFKISTPNILAITTEPGIANGIVIAPNGDGFGPGYIALGTSGDVVTAGTFVFSNNAGVDLWPSQNIATFATEEPNAGTLDLFTYDGYISLRPSNTATVIVTGGGLDVRSGYIKFPDGSTMNTAAGTVGSSVVNTFNGSSGTVTFTASNIISQLGYIPYNSTTNVARYITTASITWNNLTGKPAFAAVSTTGNYLDLNNRPVIPTVVSSFTNDVNYFTTGSLASVSGNILPSRDAVYSLGSSSTQWKSLYVSSTTIYIGGLPLSVTPDGKLNFAGSAVGAGGGFDQTLNTFDSVAFANVTVPKLTFTDNTTQTSAWTGTTIVSNLTNTVNNTSYVNSGTLSYQMLVNGQGQNFTINYSTPLTTSTQVAVQSIKFPNGIVQTQAFTGAAEPATPTVLGTVFGYTSSTYNNTLLGYNVGNVSTTGLHNIAVGSDALRSNGQGSYNVAIGNSTLCLTRNFSCNIAIGAGALSASLTGYLNLAVGIGAMSQSTAGYGNVALGYNTLQPNTIGCHNTVAGYQGLASNTSGSCNVGLGYGALSGNTTGFGNTAIGASSLATGDSGCYNTALGYQAGKNVGYENVSIGNRALTSDAGGINNIAIGSCAICSNGGGTQNVAIGYAALNKNTSGSSNLAIGCYALCVNTQGCNNIALGAYALRSNTTGCNNIAIGCQALAATTNGLYNIALGQCSLFNNTVGTGNTVVGQRAGVNISTGCCNLILGSCSGASLSGGSFNVILGNYSGAAMAASNCKIAIADQAGNLRMFFTSTGAVSFNTSTDFGSSGYILSSNGDGSPPSWASASTILSGSATTATNLTGGTQNQIPYQTAAGATSFFGPGTVGQILVSGGTSTAPTYTNTATLQVGFATNVLGGSVGQVLYQAASGATGFVGPGTSGQLLMSQGAGAPVYANTATIVVGNAYNATSATNVIGGTIGQLVYQTGLNATGFVGPGTAGQILVSGGAGAPVYTNTASIQVAQATNLLGGAAGRVPYQTASGATAFSAAGTAGTVLVSGGTGSPVFQNTLTLAGTTVATSTQTGAFQVAGGAGIGGKLYVGGNIDSPQIIASSTVTSTSTKTSNALYVAGGAWIDGSAVVSGNSIFNGTVVFNSSTIYSSNSSVSTSTNFLKIHQATGTNWTFNDGADIGMVMDYYAGSASSGFLGRTNSTGYLEWYGSGSAGATLFSGTLGTFRTGNVLVASGNANAGNTNTGALVVTGGVGISGALYVGGGISGSLIGTTTQANNLNNGATGSIPYQIASGSTTFLPIGSANQILTVNPDATAPTWTSTNLVVVGKSTTSTHIQGGTAGQIPYQTAPNLTSFFGPGTAGQILVSTGANTPNYVNTASVQVGAASNVLGGSAGSLLYQSDTSTTALLAIGAAGQILTVNAGATAPQWTNISVVSVGSANTATTATNIAGGLTGQVHYQSAPGVTGFVGPGAVGQLLVSQGSSSPAYVNTASVQVGASNNLLGGNVGSLPYQIGSGATAFIPLGTNGYILQAGSTAPEWVAIAGITAGQSTTATNIGGGTAGQLVYQQAPGVTAFAGPGTAGQVLVSGGTGTPSYTNTATFQVGFAGTAFNVRGGAAGSLVYQNAANATSLLPIGTAAQLLTVNAGATAPQWTNITAVQVGAATTATNLLGGTVYQIPYQTASGATSFFGPGAVGQLLQSNGVGAAPSYTNAPTVGTITLTTASVYNGTGISVSNVATTIDSFSTSTYRSVKYVISIASPTDYQTTEMILVHNGSNAFIAYDSVFSGPATIMTFTATVTAGLVTLQGVGTTTGNTVKVDKTYVTV
jgi:hypothetical protein